MRPRVCVYIHINTCIHIVISHACLLLKGEENTDRITKELDVGGCGIQGFTCVSVRRLGRLIPNACWVSYTSFDHF